MKYDFIQNVENLKTLPEPWKIMAFDKVFKDVSSGNKRVKKSEVNNEGKYPVIDQGQEFIAGFINDEKALIKTLPPHIVFGDHTRILKFIDFPFIIGADGTKCLKIIDEKINDAKYLFYFLLTLNIPDTGYNRHYKYLKEAKIPLPPLPIQEKIASILDDAAVLRDKTEQLLTEYDLLAQSIFLEMFGDPGVNSKKWQLIKIKDISNIDKKVVKPEDIRSGERHIGLDSIEKDTGEIVNVEIVEAGSIKSNKYFFTENHILYGRLRPYLNKVANPDFSGICSTDIITLLPEKSKTNKEFLTLFLRGDWHLNWANLNTTGANLPRLNLKAFSDYEIPVPPLDLQNQFAEKVQLIERQKEIVRQELKESEDLFQALLQQAFKGELM